MPKQLPEHEGDEPRWQARFYGDSFARAVARQPGMLRVQQAAARSGRRALGPRLPVHPVASPWSSYLSESVARAAGLQGLAQRVSRSYSGPALRATQLAPRFRPSYPRFVSDAMLERFRPSYPRFVSDAMLERFRVQIPRISALSDETRQAFRRLQELLLPSNLGALSFDDLGRVAELISEDQVGLAWAPRAEIVQELLDAPTAQDRERVLLDRAGDVLDDCDASLAETDDPTVAELAGFGRLAVEAARQGHWESAQALATNVLETALEQKRPGRVERKALLKSLERGLDDQATLLELRRVLSGCGIPPSYERYGYASRSPRFSRHGTVHCVNAALYQRLNALRAITLATSWLRLLSEDSARDDARHLPPAG